MQIFRLSASISIPGHHGGKPEPLQEKHAGQTDDAGHYASHCGRRQQEGRQRHQVRQLRNVQVFR